MHRAVGGIDPGTAMVHDDAAPGDVAEGEHAGTGGYRAGDQSLRRAADRDRGLAGQDCGEQGRLGRLERDLHRHRTIRRRRDADLAVVVAQPVDRDVLVDGLARLFGRAGFRVHAGAADRRGGGHRPAPALGDGPQAEIDREPDHAKDNDQ